MRIFIILIVPIFMFASQFGILFEGNKTFDKKILYKELGFEQSFWDKVLYRKFEPKVNEKLLDTLKKELEFFYKQEGFWHIEIKLKKDMKNKKAIFVIYENAPIIVKKIEITSDFKINNLIGPKEKERFSTKKFIKSKESIKKALLKNGFCSYYFNPKAYIYTKTNEAFLVYYVEKNSKCKIKDVNIFGLKSISKDVVLSHIYITPQDYFALEKIEQSYKKLYSLEYFRNIIIDYSKKIDNQILVDIHLKERKKIHIYKAGLGYESLNGFHINFSYKNLNFHQKQFELQTNYSQNKKEIFVKLFTPTVEIFKKKFDLVNEALYNMEKYDNFDEKKGKLGATLLKEYYDLSYKFSLFWENIDIYNSLISENSGRFDIIYPFFGMIYDKRDSKIYPKRGFYIKNDLEGSLKQISSATYIKNSAEIGFFKSWKYITFFLRTKLGFINTFQADLPSSKLFFAGGIKSNRAYSYNRLTATDSIYKSGGKSLFETTIETDFPLYKRLKAAFFWDRTVLSSKSFRYDLKPVNGVGFGFRYPTPMGNLKLDFGFDTNDFRQNALHISIGATF